MNIYEVQPIFSHPTHPFDLTIDAPGSKSITNRALCWLPLPTVKHC